MKKCETYSRGVYVVVCGLLVVVGHVILFSPRSTLATVSTTHTGFVGKSCESQICPTDRKTVASSFCVWQPTEPQSTGTFINADVYKSLLYCHYASIF